MKVLFHLISGQTMPVYIASKILKPEKNVYLYTSASDSNRNKDIIKNVISGDSDENLISAYDYRAISKSLLKLIEQYKDDECILNFTGGTKIMSVASFNLFSQKDLTSVYVDTENRDFLIFKGDKYDGKTEINCNISSEAYLKIHGQKIVFEMPGNDKTTEDKLIRCSQFLVSNFNVFETFLINFAKKNPKPKENETIIFGDDFKNHPVIKGSNISYINNTSQITLFKNGNKVLSEKMDGIDFINFLRGIWFEKACFMKIEEMKIFDSVKLNGTVKRKDRNISQFKKDKNEFDIFALKGIYPFLFECKSGYVSNEHIDKLASIKSSYLGRYSDIFFITNTKISENKNLEKLKDKRIRHITYDELDSLKEIINKVHQNL